MPGMDNKRLQEALGVVRNDRKEAAKFIADPEGYLQAKGIDTEGLKFAQVNAGELTDDDLEAAAGGLAPQVCNSTGVGEGVQNCTSVGDGATEVME